MKVSISRLHHPVTVLGPGRRAGIWFQGCGIRCPGCVSVDTWRRDDRAMVGTGTILDWLTGLPPDQVDGVTISGGEPTEQPEALAEILTGVGRWRRRRPAGLPEPDVLVYTGRDPAWLDRPEAAMLAGADVVIAGPYVAAEAGRSALRGSDNQRLVTLTDLGARRYAGADSRPRAAVQIAVTGREIWMIGIPLPGDLAAVRQTMTDRGIQLKGPSWPA